MVDRKIILVGIVIIGALIGMLFDPMNLRNRFAEGNPGSENAITGAFTAGNSSSIFLPAILFLVVMGLFYAVWKNQNPNEE